MNITSNNTSKRTSRVAFIFTSSRDEIVKNLQEGNEADTALRGLNHMENTDYFTISSKSIRALLFIPKLLRYDFVIAQDNLLLGYIVSICARIFCKRTKWLYIAMNSSTLIKRNSGRPIRLFFLKTFWKSYERIICLSYEQLEDFARLGISRSHLIFISFAIDVEFFKPTVVFQEEGNLIVSVGRDAGRDYLTLFKAAEKVSQAFIIVASPKNIPSSTPIPSNVSVLYDRSLVEIRDLYRRAKLVVIVSKDTDVPEGSDCSGQTVILDALAAGKTVIATHRSWITDYFVPGKDLVVVEPNNPEALVSAIKILWNDDERRKQLAVSGHEKVTNKYNTKIFARALTELMNSLT